ncbi:unnamed protein product [Protopolystoma xenopodis]|uniref:Uncharacterized protein n=1 Tax=Protopolystoma xenopodis TaxID=117903 RepID=A0A3S5BGI9_9PLAT|nr:unnamed protein product [Protopolystoma xenopodis]
MACPSRKCSIIAAALFDVDGAEWRLSQVHTLLTASTAFIESASPSFYFTVLTCKSSSLFSSSRSSQHLSWARRTSFLFSHFRLHRYTCRSKPTGR